MHSDLKISNYIYNHIVKEVLQMLSVYLVTTG